MIELFDDPSVRTAQGTQGLPTVYIRALRGTSERATPYRLPGKG